MWPRVASPTRISSHYGRMPTRTCPYWWKRASNTSRCSKEWPEGRPTLHRVAQEDAPAALRLAGARHILSPSWSQLLGLRFVYTLLTSETILAPFFVGLHLIG